MNSEPITKLLEQYENIESILFTTDYSDFETFTQMQNFLQSADASFSTKIDDLDQRMSTLHEEYIRTSTVYEINNKKRAKEEELLVIERQKIEQELEKHKKRLEVPVQPITLVLKERERQIKTLNQTKQIIRDFTKLIKGDEQQIKKLMPLQQKSFSESALKIYIFKQLLQTFDNPEYDTAKNEIRKKFSELKNKIFINFKEAYYKKDVMLIKMCLPYCEEYELMDEISEFYNEQVFKESHKIVKLAGENSGDSEIKNFFFLLERGFHNAFNLKPGNETKSFSDKGQYEVYGALGQYGDIISRKLISYVFEKLIKESIENVLKSTYSCRLHLSCLEIFYTECKGLLKNLQPLIRDQRIIHLMGTYFESVFDSYLQTYLSKQTSFLSNTLQQHISQVVQQIKNAKLAAKQTMQVETTKKFSIKKIMDFKIQEKVYNPELIKHKIQTLNNIFMASSLEKIFMSVKQCLNRNMKISKINQVDRNRTELLAIFIKNLSELMEVLISAIGQIVPGFTDKSLALQPEFFHIIPNINLLLQRMEYLYIENKKQAKYQFAEALKIQQKKEALIIECEKKLNKIVGDALANILTIENTILKSNQNQYFITHERQKVRQHNETVCAKVISFLQKYLRPINKINLVTYRSTLLKLIGLQFINLLISHYSRINYTKQGLGMIFIDIANYKKIIIQIDFPQIDEKYKVLRSLIDIYVIKNEEKAINGYLKTEKETALKNQKEETIKDYIENKAKNQREL